MAESKQIAVFDCVNENVSKFSEENAPTGFGKSLVFQAIPVVADILMGELPGTSILIIICPLVSLMLDQVESLKRNGFNAAAIYQGQDEKILSDIENGLISHVFASPESMMSLGRWRNMVNSYAYANHCVGIAVDEAHCISSWGFTTQPNKSSFRKNYKQLGELLGLFSKTVQFAVFTATATTTTKLRIFESLNINAINTFVIERNPVKKNISFCVQYASSEAGTHIRHIDFRATGEETLYQTDNDILSVQETMLFALENI
eukprot:gene1537-1700_t